MSSTTDPTPAAEPAAATPDYLLDPNAVLGDESAKWRYGRAPDYSKTRKVYEESRTQNHVAASLPNLVENLVKNWEVEASFKPNLEDWRTVDHANYSFAINGGPPQTAEHMLKVGTYNAIIAPNEFYDSTNMDFNQSHKTFKRMMPTFAWEVIEVYSGPPVVAFKWRHWGTMKNDYVGNNNKGEKVRVKAHGGSIDIQGITVAKVDDKVRLQSVETWFDPMEMFRQIVAGRGEEVITRTDINSGSASESEETITKQTPAGDVRTRKESETTIAAHQKEEHLEKTLESAIGVPVNEENSETQADKLAQVDEIKQTLEKHAVKEEKPDIKQLAEQIKALAEQIAQLQASEKSSNGDGKGTSSPEPTWEKVENPHGGSANAPGSFTSGSGCPFMP